MLVVKLEVWPFGQKAAAREIGRLQITNTGGSEEACSYDVQASGDAAGDLRSTAHHGLRHARREGAWKLVALALQALLAEDRKRR